MTHHVIKRLITFKRLIPFKRLIHFSFISPLLIKQRGPPFISSFSVIKRLSACLNGDPYSRFRTIFSSNSPRHYERIAMTAA